MAEIHLETKDVSIAFGGVEALKDVSIQVLTGEVVGLIGPNGAGKTTLFNCITRFLQPDEGDIIFEGQSLLRKRPYELAHMGISRTFQNMKVCEDMTVFENILLGAHNQIGNPFAAMLSFPSARKKEMKLKEEAIKVAKSLKLADQLNYKISSLPFGSRKFAEFARAMVSRPRLLLLDEPAAGCNEEETRAVSGLIKLINREFGTTILLVEHDMSLVMEVSQRIYVLDSGRLIAEGTPEEILSNPRVIDAYLGEDNR